MVGIIEKMQAEIAELRAKVEKLEGGAKLEGAVEMAHRILEKTQTKSPQQLRDEIVEKAKHDVAELLSQNHPGASIWFSSNAGIIITDKCEFVVSSEKRTVVALIKTLRGGKLVDRGIAKCAPDDCFNSHIGKAIALRRALGLEVPAEYLKAPQPTEVRVGDLASTEDILGNTYKISVNCEAVQAKFIEDIALERYGAKIIDDSREKVSE